jgi:ABC-type multidrug transport system ATPase subunit
MLVAEDLVKRYGTSRALDGFSLTVVPGEILGLVGHNGAGKTTFVEVVTGLVRPRAGAVHVCGIDALRNKHAARGLIGVAPQEQALYLPATVREHLRLYATLAGLRGAKRRFAIVRTAEELLLTDVLDRRAGVLSGGQRRRTQAACALVASPPVLLLDEPTVGADPTTRAALLRAVAARAEEGAAIVYTTHYLPELAELSATLAVASCGRIIASGSQADLLSGLPSQVVLGFAGRPPAGLVNDGELVDGLLSVRSMDPAATLAGLVGAGHLPQYVDVRKPGLDDLYRMLAQPEVSHAA